MSKALSKEELEGMFKKQNPVAFTIGLIIILWNLFIGVTAIMVLTKLALMAWKWLL